MVTSNPALTAALADIGPRLRQLRTRRGVTLAQLAAATGISQSTLSRLKSGQRRPSLELLLPIAHAHEVTVDDLVALPRFTDPRVQGTMRRVAGRTILPLTRRPGPVQAYKITIPADEPPPDPKMHDGHEWLYVLSGRLRLILGTHELELDPGEAAEFDTRQPHWFGSAGPGPVEILSIFGGQGERIHLRARTKT
ncbi:helix-turn-helix domain-containing protein [Nocardia blacklockiae]|uniref:helix-turn-helix domain-containing protein n=1 Tax=Nocardia blacklockiae TaxID=480036 RepID=UPI002B4B3A17|nr:XRE family transcriptional regulator [Nocardia blacklockiae]